MVGYSDSSWNDDKETGRSTAAYVYILNGAPISWRSKQQNVVSLSSGEAEYVAASEACKEAVFLMELLNQLGIYKVIKSVKLMLDSTTAMSLCKNPINHPKTKHIRMRYHHIRELVEEGVIVTEWVGTEGQIADPLTKSLPASKLDHVKKLLSLSETLN